MTTKPFEINVKDPQFADGAVGDGIVQRDLPPRTAIG